MTVSPGTVGEFVGPGVKIACGDEWIIVNKLKVEGRYVNSADVLKPGSRLSERASTADKYSRSRDHEHSFRRR